MADVVIPDVKTLATQISEGSIRALGRGLTWVESGGPRAEALSARMFPNTGRAQVVGLTGAPGSGKSTLARALALVARARGRTGADVQALKAGRLEIADVRVVNNAEREGADRAVAELRAMLTLLPTPEAAWVPPVLAASAARDEGIEAIADALDGHMAFLKTSGELERRRRRI